MMSLTSFVLLAASIAAVAAQLTVNTPTSVVHCLPVQITWSGGAAPYYVSILPGGQPSATPLVDFGKQTGTSISWTATLPANTPCTVQIRDNSGALNYSDQFTIQSGTMTTCKDDSGATSTPAASAPGTASTGVATANSSAPKTPAASNSTSSASTSPSYKSTPSTTPSTSGAASPSTSTSTTASPVNGSSPASDARSDAIRTSAGTMAIAVAAVVAVFA